MTTLHTANSTGLAEVACNGNPDDVRGWLCGRSRPDVTKAFLELRELALGWLRDDLPRCRRVLNAVLPVLGGGEAGLVPLFAVFLTVAAQADAFVADELFELSIALAAKENLCALAAKCAAEWGQFCLAHGRFEEADRHLERAQGLWHLDDRSDQAEKLFVARAQVAARGGDWTCTIQRIETWIGDCRLPLIRARLYLDLSDAYARCGQPCRADDALRTAEDLCRAADDEFSQQLASVYRARWFSSLGAYQRAASMFQASSRWLVEHHYSTEADFARANKASLAVAEESDLAEAVTTLRDLLRRPGGEDPLVRWQLTMNLAVALEKQGNYTEASQFYASLSAERPVRPCDRKLAELNCLHLRIHGGHFAADRSLSSEPVPSSSPTQGVEDELQGLLHDEVIASDPLLRFLAHEILGDWHRTAGAAEKSAESYAEALGCVEESRLALPWEFLRRQFQQARLRVFDRLQQALLGTGRCEEAWQVVDRAKAQSLADFLGGSYPKLDESSRANLLTIRQQLRSAYRAAPNGTPANSQEREQITRLECLLDETLGHGRRTYEDKSVVADWRNWPDLQRAEVALVDFVEIDGAWGAYVVHDGQVRFVRLAGREAVRNAVQSIKTWWERHARQTVELQEDQWQEETSAWHALLIAPLADHLQGARRLIVVPHGKLCLLPWAGLWDSTAGAYLVDRFDQGISVLPGARVGRLLNRPRNDAAADLDLVVNPQSDLLFDEFEADWVLRRLGGQSRLLTAADADEENLRVLLPRCRWLHFCGHGEFDLARPMASHLKLSGGDRWTGWDMLSAPLPSTTVILSACEVGSAHAEAAGEWFGVLRGLLMAGASSVLACLWKISDLVCLPFIQSFYEEHGANRGDLGAALRAAQLHVRELGSWASLAQGAGCLEQVDWQHGVDPHRSPLLEIGAPSLAHRAMELLSTALNLWLKGPLGHLARDRQVLQQLDRQLRFLAQLSHPRWWSAFQLYGCHGTGNRLVSPTEEAQGP